MGVIAVLTSKPIFIISQFLARPNFNIKSTKFGCINFFVLNIKAVYETEVNKNMGVV